MRSKLIEKIFKKKCRECGKIMEIHGGRYGEDFHWICEKCGNKEYMIKYV